MKSTECLCLKLGSRIFKSEPGRGVGWRWGFKQTIKAAQNVLKHILVFGFGILKSDEILEIGKKSIVHNQPSRQTHIHCSEKRSRFAF